MTSSIGLLVVFADVVISLALVVAVASPSVSQLARPVIATFALACAWLLTAVFDALRAPGWTMFMSGAVIVVGIVVITVTVHLWAQGGVGGESGPGQRGDHGGGGPRRRRPDAPQQGGGGSDPSWWPEFERQFAFCVAEREREATACRVPGRAGAVRHHTATLTALGRGRSLLGLARGTEASPSRWIPTSPRGKNQISGRSHPAAASINVNAHREEHT
jgi:hypothetical protein